VTPPSLSNHPHVLPSSLLNCHTLKLILSNLTVHNVYRPPPTKTRKSVTCSVFLSALNALLTLAVTNSHEFLITGDFNLHLDKPDDSQVKQFLPALDSINLTQHVSFPTHRDHHILDLVISATSSSLHPVIDHSSVSPSEHFPIFRLCCLFVLCFFSLFLLRIYPSSPFVA